MSEILALVIGAILGAALGYLIARVRLSSRAVAAEVDLEKRLTAATTELEAARRETAARLAWVEEARKRLEESFKALAGDTLRANSDSFLKLARGQIETLVTRADGSMKDLLKPMADTLKRYEDGLRSVEKDRQGAYAALREQVTNILRSEAELRKETVNLTQALKLPQVRGQWGEMTLHRTAEIAGMAEHCDFAEQVTLKESRQRPDMVVHLPGGREIVVDSKVSLLAYLDAIDASTEEEREKKLAEHARQVRSHMMSLASKGYAAQFENAPDFVVLFLPGEAFFSTAVHCDHMLIEDGMARGVILATPTTLVALLRAVAHGWRQTQLEENAKRISVEGHELYKRIGTLLDHLDGIGTGLRNAVARYNNAVSSINLRFIPSARRLKELGATDAAALDDLDPVDETPRRVEPTDTATPPDEDENP